MFALSILAKTRPRVVLTTGAALAVPFAYVGRLFGTRTVFVDCGGRVDSNSLSFKLTGLTGARRYVQWPTLAHGKRRYRGQIDLSQALSDDLRPHQNTDGSVLVTVGTGSFPFDRLLEAVSKLDPSVRLVVQRGPSRVVPPSAESVVDFMAFGDLLEAMSRAQAVVSHAGIGSIGLALACGKRPIVLPRRAALGENVDDHQVAFADAMEELGCVKVARDDRELGQLLASQLLTPPNPPLMSTALVDELRRELESLAGPPRRSVDERMPD
jgi:UDP-N-acetylglucosamine transferase subunit ALG13